MVSPNLIKKNEIASDINPNAKKIFQLILGKKMKSANKNFDDDVPKIHVSHIVSRLSFLYEKIRNAVDYDDDHLLRKNAIKRLLKRYIVIEGLVRSFKSEEMSYNLLTELIQAGYLPNDKIPVMCPSLFLTTRRLTLYWCITSAASSSESFSLQA